MKIFLLLVVLALVVLVGAMIFMWYVFVLALVVLLVAVGVSFWVTVQLVGGITDNPQLAQGMGIAVALATFVGFVSWAYRAGSFSGTKKQKFPWS